MVLAMARHNILKVSTLACGVAIYSLSCPAAKAIEIDPYPGDGKCYFIENNQKLDYNRGAYSKALLEENPWYGDQTVSEIAATKFYDETNQTWRFAWKATSGNTNNGQTDALNTWYYARDQVRTGFYSDQENVSTFAEGFEYACVGNTPGDGAFDNLNIPGVINKLRGADRRKIGKLLSALLFPRNVIAAGGLATQAYINDLADTILERLPTRQFLKIHIEEEITDVEIKETITEPVRGLWKTSGSAEVDIEIASIEMDGGIYVDDPNLTSIYTEPNGTRAWVRGFGGSMSPYETGGAYGKRGLVFYPDVYNDFYSTHGGLVVGVDTSVSDNLQLGIFGNYGNINLQQFATSDTGGGSWTPNGYGGGVMASYWDDNFYVQGAFGVTAFSGDNKRQVKVAGVLDETYTATKETTSYMGTVRVGAPFAWGGLILEPQATAIWNGNEDASYTESGKYRAFAIKLNSYSDNFLRTALGAKLAWPIKQGESKLIVPNIKVAWLADWDTNNGEVKFKRANSKAGVTGRIPSNQETQNGVLVEGGVDYAIARGPTTAWKLYAKGGAKLWVNKAADWRTSGGITFQF
jgi:hypothetical protein